VGRGIRIGLLLTAAACLVAVLVDWAVQELNTSATQAGIEAEQAIAEAGQEEPGRAQDATEESHDQGVR
jgi:hypothetical protein